MFENLKYSYQGSEGKPLIDYNDFISKYPIVLKQSEVIKGFTINF